MTKYSENAMRLYNLLSDLPPDLLAEAFPEAGAPSPTPPIYSPKRHIRRLVRAIVIYAACAMLVLGTSFLLPKLFDRFTPITPPPEPTSDYPVDYYRPDLIWANEKYDPRRENAVVGQYHTIDFDFSEDESAVYAIYVFTFSDKYVSYTKDFQYSGADFEDLSISSQDHYRIKENALAHYYAGTREQIEAYFNYIEEHYTSGEDSKRFRIRLAYQTLTAAILNGMWNTEPLRPSEITGFESTIPYPYLLNCLSGSTSTPMIAPNAKEITFEFKKKQHDQTIVADTHTLLNATEQPDLAVLINGTWYDLPWKIATKSPVTKVEVPENDSVSITLSFDGFPYDELPCGQYRFRIPFQATHTHTGFTPANGEQTQTVLFMVSSGEDCIPSNATQGLAYTLLEDGTYSVSASAYLTDTDIVIPSIFNSIPVTAVGENGFNHWESITSVELPDTLQTIGASAFNGCISMKTINLPDSLTTMGIEAFSGCSALERIIIPNSVTRLGYGTFAHCIGAITLVLPDSLTHIDEYAFHNCYNLTRLTIPASVEYIGESAFRSCSKLGAITFKDPANWLSASGPVDLSSPQAAAQWLVHTAGKLTRGSAQDYLEGPRWSITDSNWDTPLYDYESASQHFHGYKQTSEGYYIIPHFTDSKTNLTYHFYCVTDDPNDPYEFYQALIRVCYEDENLSVDGQFYVHPSLFLHNDSEKNVVETAHDGTRRTYTIYLDGVVLADVFITAKDPSQSNLDQLHRLAVDEIVDRLKIAS